MRTPRSIRADGQGEYAMRAAHECREELERLIGQAIRYLESADLRNANEALKRANAEAATLHDGTLPPELKTTASSKTRGGAADDGATSGGGREVLGDFEPPAISSRPEGHLKPSRTGRTKWTIP